MIDSRMLSWPATVERSAADCAPDAFDVATVPGKWVPDKLRRHEAVTRLVRALYEKNKPVKVIRHAGQVGISAGIDHGHRATGSLGIRDDLIKARALWVDAPVFRHGP